MIAPTMQTFTEPDTFILTAIAIVAGLVIGYFVCAMGFLFYAIFKTRRTV